MSRLGLGGFSRSNRVSTPVPPQVVLIPLRGPKLNGAVAIVFPDGTMTQVMREVMIELNLLRSLSGAGSPEGKFEGFVNQEYIDTAGTTGNIKYVKRDASIGGDISKGWILV